MAEDTVNICFWLLSCWDDCQCIYRGTIFSFPSEMDLEYQTIVSYFRDFYFFSFVHQFFFLLFCLLCFLFSVKSGILLVHLLPQQKTAFCLQPVKHMRLFRRVRIFQLMCSRPVSLHQLRWHYGGQLFSLFFLHYNSSTCYKLHISYKSIWMCYFAGVS